jgi:hypothetical protein
MNGVPARLQHPDLFGYNDVFSASLLISIVGNEDLHGWVGKASKFARLPLALKRLHRIDGLVRKFQCLASQRILQVHLLVRNRNSLEATKLNLGVSC